MKKKQECIPVGCILSAAVAVCWGGGVSARGVSAQGAVSAQGGQCLPGGVCIPACTEADTPLVDRMTDRCQNITLPQTSLRTVKTTIYLELVNTY